MKEQLYRAKTTNEQKLVYGDLIKKKSKFVLSEYYIEDYEGMGHYVITETIEIVNIEVEKFKP